MYRILPSFTEFYLVLLVFTGYYRILHSFYWDLLGFTGFYRVLPNFTWFYRFFLGGKVDLWLLNRIVSSFTEFYRVLPSFTEFFFVRPSRRQPLISPRIALIDWFLFRSSLRGMIHWNDSMKRKRTKKGMAAIGSPATIGRRFRRRPIGTLAMAAAH